MRGKKSDYRIKDKANRKTVVGRISVNSRGFGFLTAEDRKPGDEDIYISANNLHYAMNGDMVEAALIQPSVKGRASEGDVIRIIEHANKVIIGTFSASNKFGFVIPDNSRLKQDVFIPGNEINGAVTGAKVVAEITQWPEDNLKPEGRIIEVLGMKGEPGVDILSIMRDHDLDENFPEEVQEAADAIETEVNPEEHKNRLDRRNFHIVTIDGEDAKDLDDGVYAERREDGNYFLGVYIADVSHYVTEGSVLDREAFDRGTSVYMVDRVCPMLPKALSNGICSLNAGVDRLAMACEMVISPEGAVVSYEIAPAIIHVYRRLSYTIVNKILVDREIAFIEDHKDIVPMLEILGDLRNIMKRYRDNRGSINFVIPEIKVKMDMNGKAVGLVKRTGSFGESLIEQCMLAANETVAEHMCRKKLPFMYRVHLEPDEEKITRLNNLLSTFGLFLRKNSRGTVTPKQMQMVLDKVAGQPGERIISTVALRSMQQACYSVSCDGHFGLAAEYYTHFTSPIRRYPDLIVHRVLRETFETGTIPEDRQSRLRSILPGIAEQSSQRERRAVEAERESTDLKKVEYMAGFVGEEFEGIISNVTGFGMFVELDNGVEGLVHVTSLQNDYYEYIEDQYSLVGRHSGYAYRLGDPIVVIMARADIDNKSIDFVVKDNGRVGEDGPVTARSRGRRGMRIGDNTAKKRNKSVLKSRGRTVIRGTDAKKTARRSSSRDLSGDEIIADVNGGAAVVTRSTGFEKFMKAYGMPKKRKKSKGRFSSRRSSGRGGRK